MRARSFTLIELLAVIVIMALVAGIASVSLAATGDAARLQAAAARWRDLDAMARLFARCGEPVRRSGERHEGGARVLRFYEERGGLRVRETARPAASGVSMRVTGDGTAAVVVDDATGERLAAQTLPAGATGRLVVSAPGRSRGEPAVAFDRLGRSLDYEVVLTAGERTLRWRVHGLTGLVSEATP